ncbi:MAG: sugar phosphate nucleotidyltransferase [Nitrospira sp.]|nr:sugar phosphate nucleotidyltransferase [Nitrospira sp.]
MTSHHTQTERTIWSIVLAGGEGERVKPLVLRWLGRHRPKQYCTFVGKRSMFEHTVDRAIRVASAERTVVVAANHHRTETRDQLGARPIRKTIHQPMNRDTAAGIFLPLSYVRARDPHAMVVIQPSDHFIYPEGRFLTTIRQAIAAATESPDRLLLLGVQPDRLETEYGWIQRGTRLSGSPGYPVHAVSSFLEKPEPAQADAALQAGGLWNTLVLATSVEMLWETGWACFPDMMPIFDRVVESWDTPHECAVVEDAYRRMPAYNFSSQLLQRMPDCVAVMELTDVLWSDWGKPERIAETIRRIGKTPAFPLSCLEAPYMPHRNPLTTAKV